MRRLKPKPMEAPPKQQSNNNNNNKKLPQKSVEIDDEIIRKVKAEQLRISINLQHLVDYSSEYYKFEWNKAYRVLKQSDDDDVNPLNWTIEQVVDNLQKVCSSEDILAQFKEQEIDGAALLDLSKEDLHTLMSIKLGPSIKISNFIEKLRRNVCGKFIVLDSEDNEFAHLKS